MPAPIVIMSFNRAQFLAPVLASLKAQSPNGVEGREVHLFQDGAVNRYSRLRYAKDNEISDSVALFKREFPEGVVHLSPDNIGICENFRRAEEYVFVERQFECAWFFEDDLVLSPVYFRMMEHLQNFAESVDNVAYFAAYGDYYAPADEVAERRRDLMTLDHHWGFGLLARHWRAIQPRLRAFYDIVVGSDYSRRDHRAIFSIYTEGNASPRASSQDAAKAFACNQEGLWRCNTVVPFAKYIGTSGQHMTPEIFRELGFDRTEVADLPVFDLNLPGPSGIRERVLEQRLLFEAVRRDETGKIIEGLPPRMLNPMRLCTQEDIETAYHLLLRRAVESDELFKTHVGFRPLHILVSAIIRSREFMDLTDGDPEEFRFRDATSRGLCSRSDVYNIYTILCHREPEASKIDEYAGTMYLDRLIQGTFRSKEFLALNEQIES